ncbi:MAG: hypothetical protein LUG88_04445 [Clostridia bacterium]|nr:hypothetical protein [Clostridia bacterium]
MLVNKYYNSGAVSNIVPLDIDVGDLSDIVVPFEKSSLIEQMNSLFKSGCIRPSTDVFQGNIKREEMRKSFYELGNNQGYEIISLGFGAEYF